MTGDFEVIGVGYQWRRLSLAQARAVAAALEAGASASQLAAEYGVSSRTIHRARRRVEAPLERIRAGRWEALYAITEDGPVRMSPWYPT